MILFKSALLGLSWGLLQGMIMFPGGVRLHDSFGWYHVISVISMIAFAVWLYQFKKFQTCLDDILVVLGMLILVWEFSEIGYRLSRYDISGWYEHICFFDVISIYLSGYKVALMHIVRSLISVILIWRFTR